MYVQDQREELETFAFSGTCHPQTNHVKCNDKGIYQAPSTINSSFEDIEGTAWKYKMAKDLKRDLDWKGEKTQSPHLQMFKIHEKDFIVQFQSQKNKKSAQRHSGNQYADNSINWREHHI